ncbi:MAG: plasmid pRiA4b ORF-3 family protein [Sporosarcina sp.]
MKAYILKLSFEDITPLIWRRVILPAGATFNRLHETIQNVTNFQSGMFSYHSFGVEIEDYFITNNEHILDEYKGTKYVGRTVKQPTRIKIDACLEKYGHFIYNYDFGDDWRIRVELEDTVEDYYFGYPTLLDGEGTAPPEDVGGPSGYETFKSIYHEPTHPDYMSTRTWAQEQHYLPLDKAWVNDRLKFVKYKKTEWQFIDHDNYYVLSDKYRGEESVDIDKLPNTDLLIQYAQACANLYGMITYSKFLEIYNAQNEPSLSRSELRAFMADSHFSKLLEKMSVLTNGLGILREEVEYSKDFSSFLEEVYEKPYYVPEKEELLRYADDLYYEKTNYQEKLANMLAKDFFGGSTLMVKDEIDELVGQLQEVHVDLQGVVRGFLERFNFKDMKQVNEYVKAVSVIANSTRIWENRGHTPGELFEMEKQHLHPLSSASFSVIEGGKTGRNEPCPCGSGKKYKKCCGK